MISASYLLWLVRRTDFHAYVRLVFLFLACVFIALSKQDIYYKVLVKPNSMIGFIFRWGLLRVGKTALSKICANFEV